LRKIQITAGAATATAILSDNETADAVWNALPISAQGNRWGKEIYFEIPVRITQAANAREVMTPGELGYWPVGQAFCIFWGATPASQGDEPRAYSPVNPFGQLEGDPHVFDAEPSGTQIRLTKVTD
jgi:hypothetical protein